MSSFKDMTITIVGMWDCPRVTHIKALISDLTQAVSDLPQFNYNLSFETEFNLEKEKLLKEDLAFLQYSKSPIIYSTTSSSNKKTIIGSLEEFQNYCIENFMYHDKRNTPEFEEETKKNLQEFLITNGNKYVYFNFGIEKSEPEEGKNEEEKLEQVIIELFNNQLPKTCANFLSLCKGDFKNSKDEVLTYENSTINRVSPNSFLQGGNIKVSGDKSIYGKNFNDERYDIKHNTHGIIGMVKKGGVSHTNECQFYITLAPLNCFDGKFVAFGRVIKGFETIRKIGVVKTDLQRPVDRIYIAKCGEFDVDQIKI